MNYQSSEELVRELRQSDANAAWRQFFSQYAWQIRNYAQGLGLSAADADDVLQETMISLMQVLPDFVCDPQLNFRSFVLTVCHRKVLRLFRSKRRRTAALDRFALHKSIEDHANTHGVAAPVLSDGDPPWRQVLFEAAWQDYRSRSATAPHVLEAFEALALKGEDPAGVAVRLGLKINAVYQIKNRLTKILGLRVAELEKQLEV